MVYFLQSKIEKFNSNIYKKIIIVNLVCSYGMLVSFIAQGYGAISIFFSTLSIVVAFVFGYHYFKDLKKISRDYLAINWFKAAIVFNIISCLGTFYLDYMMMSRNIVQDLYLSSIYYYPVSYTHLDVYKRQILLIIGSHAYEPLFTISTLLDFCKYSSIEANGLSCF